VPGRAYSASHRLTERPAGRDGRGGGDPSLKRYHRVRLRPGEAQEFYHSLQRTAGPRAPAYRPCRRLLRHPDIFSCLKQSPVPFGSEEVSHGIEV